MSELRQINPADLHIGDNIRTDATASADMVASVQACGVLLPILAHTDDHGRAVVIDGQLRTLAARQAGLETVPVYLTDSPDDEVERLIEQWVTNERRQALTNTHKIAAVEQLALLGVSEAQISKRTGTQRGEVAAAFATSHNAAAREVADSLTLDQAATLAELGEDETTVDELVKAATEGRFEHKASRIRQDRDEARAKAELAATLTAQGFTIIEDQPSHYSGDGAPAVRLASLCKDSDTREPLDEAEHASCPGHVLYIGSGYTTVYVDAQGTELDEAEAFRLEEVEMERRRTEDGDDADDLDGWEDIGLTPIGRQIAVAVPACTQAAALHVDRYSYSSGPAKTKAADMGEKEREAAKAERKRVIENNAAWRAAEPVRREWLTQFVTRKTPPKGAEQIIARHVLSNHTSQWGVLDVLGQDSTKLTTELKTCTPKRATMIALAYTLAAWENQTSTETWRRANDDDKRILIALSEWGYGLSEVEQATTKAKPNKR